MSHYNPRDGIEASTIRRPMRSGDVLEILDALESKGLQVWLNGGWGVDALLGYQTRDHEDLDITIPTSSRVAFNKIMQELGFTIHRVDNDYNWVLSDKDMRLVDVHLVDFSTTVRDEHGRAMYGPKGLSFEVGSLEGRGTIEGRPVKCETAEFQVAGHTGYELDECDYQDVKALSNRFSIPLPAEHMSELVRRGYEIAADAYARGRDNFENVRFLSELAGRLKKRATVLDLGCGSGRPVDRFLVDRGFKIIGLDISERQIALAKRNVPEATFTVSDMTKLRDKEFHVDAVVSFYAIFHTPRGLHADMFRCIRSFLDAGGWILVSMGAREAEGTESDFHDSEMYWSHYGPEKNRVLIEQSGFVIELDEIDESGGERHQIVLARAT